MRAVSDPNGRASRLLPALLLGVLVIICLGIVYFVGDLANFQEAIAAKEARAALRGVDDPAQLDPVLQRYPSNKILRLIALAGRASTDLDSATKDLLDQAEPRRVPKLADLGGAGRSALEALSRDLQAAEGNTATFETRYAAQVKAERDKVESEALSLNLATGTMASFMAMIDRQNTELTALASRTVAAHVDYYRAYRKCVTLLIGEFGIYRVEGGQFVFPFQSTANSYNNAAAAVAAAETRIAELEAERTSLRQVRLQRWKEFVEH